MICELLPVHPVHILAVEAGSLLTYYFFVHDFTLLDAVDVTSASHGDRLGSVGLRIKGHGRAPQYEELRTLLVRGEEGIREPEGLL